MPPKGLSAAQKQAAAVTWLRNSRTVHSLKDLEKALPSVASINGMQLKDFLTSLQDENMISVEKIGSGNWYWSFASDEQKSREAALERLRAERDSLMSSVDSMKEKLGEIQMSDEEKEEQQKMTLDLEEEKGVVERLEKELDGYRDGDPMELERKRMMVERLKGNAENWTDNIHILEQVVAQMLGGDREQLDGLKREVYGDDYVEGEGLKEWED